MRRECRARLGDDVADLNHLFDGNPALLSGEFGGVFGVFQLEQFDEPLEGAGFVRVSRLKPHLPVNPVFEEVAVVGPLVENHLRPTEEESGLGAGPGRHPVVSHCGGVREARVDDNQLGTIHHPLQNPLRVRVEVMAGFKV